MMEESKLGLSGEEIKKSEEGSGIAGLLRAVACEKMVHWPTAAFAELVWEHIGKYRRDPMTGRLTE